MDEALGIVKRMDQIRKGQELRDDEKGPFSINAGSSIPDIPDDYEDYVPPNEAENDEKKSRKRKKWMVSGVAFVYVNETNVDYCIEL